MGKPAPVQVLAEAGPGRGTLMADALRAIRKMAPDFAAALRLHLIENSPRLRAAQAERLPGAIWHDDVFELPAGPLLLLANEFLDALPIRQFLCRGAGWTERYVDDGAFVEIPAAAPPRCASDGEIVEISETALSLATTPSALPARGHLVWRARAADRLRAGTQRRAGDSLRTVQPMAGKPADPLAAPGLADLTAHVDFQAIAEAARTAGAAVHGPLPQGIFLTRLGLFQRAGALRPNPAAGPRRRDDRGGAAPRRARSDGAAVQGAGALPPWPADPTGI